MVRYNKILFLFYFILISSLSFPQIWCRPGATWHFTHYNPGWNMYTKHTYVKDTLILSKNCNKITYYSQGWGLPGPVAYFGSPIYTHVNGNVVYILDQTTNNFDTLFNFGATIGDAWRLAPKSALNCSNSKATVLDTGHVMIQTQNLKWFKVQLDLVYYLGPYTIIDTIVERIGAFNKYFYYHGDMCPTLPDTDFGGPFRCYEDNQITGYKHNFTQVCNWFFNMGTDIEKNNNNAPDFDIYPNPNSGTFFIETGQLGKDDEISIVNILGQEIKKAKLISNKTEINISNLSSGIYYLKISQENKTVSSKKIIKQ